MSFAIDIEKLYQKLGYQPILYHYNHDSEIFFQISIPKEYGSLPFLIDIEGLERVTYDDLFDYFEELRDLEIRYLNGISTRIKWTFLGRCNNCEKTIGPIRYYSFNSWEDYCLECGRQSDLELVQMYDTFPVQCSLCKKEIYENVLKPIKIASNCAEYYERYNLCPSCLETDLGQKEFQERRLELVGYKVKSDQTRFGSLLDWVPIYESRHDPEANYIFILYNINKISPDYQKLACCSRDDEGRMGYYKFPEPYSKLGDSIKELIQKQLSRHYKIKDQYGKSSWESYYSGPLQLAMAELGMKIHYQDDF